MPPTDPDGPQWNPVEVKKLMHANGIENPNQLAKDVGASRSALYATFDENWAGTVSLRAIELLMKHYGADFGPLIKRTRTVRRTGHSGRRQSAGKKDNVSDKREGTTTNGST